MTETRAPIGQAGLSDRLVLWWDRGVALQVLAAGQFFTWVPVFFATGTGLYFALRFEPDPALYPLLIALSVCLPFMARTHAVALPYIWAVSFGLLGFALAGQQAHRLAAPVLDFRYYGPIEGRVVSIDRSASDKLRLTLDTVRLDRVAPVDRPLRVRVSLHGQQGYFDPSPGQMVMMTGHLSPPSGPVEPGGFDFQRHAWFQQLGAVGYTRTPALLQAPAEISSFQLWLSQTRIRLSDIIADRIEGREGGFATAILTGDRSSVDPVALESLRASNLAHLLAISGLHMGLLTGVVFAVVRMCFALCPAISMRCNPKKIAALCAFMAAAIYLGISGASVATQRAFIMVCVMLLAVCLDQRAITLRAVAVAALIVLALRPVSLMGPGFQMSFAATTALVACFAVIRDRHLFAPLPNWARNVASLVISSAVAGIATAPFGAFHFNQIAQFGLIANLLSVPVMGLLVMPGAVLAAVLSPFGLEQIGFEAMRYGIIWILSVAERVAALDGAVTLVPSPGVGVLPALGVGGCLLCLSARLGQACGALLLASTIAHWSQVERPGVLVSDTGTLIGVLTEEGRVLNKPKGDGFVARAWLENDGDAADQAQASARSGPAAPLQPKQGRITLGSHAIWFDARQKDQLSQSLERLCERFELLILPKIYDPPPCPAYTAQTLRGSGALAMSASGGGLQITSSRDVRGARLWVPDQPLSSR